MQIFRSSKKIVVFLNPSKVENAKLSVFPVFQLLQKIHILEVRSTLTQINYGFYCPSDINRIQAVGDGTECGDICLAFVHVICFRSEFPNVCDQYWLNNFRVYLFNSLLCCKRVKPSAKPNVVVTGTNTHQM